ncbi:hypothetical protein EMIHUDRAFT_211848 [Emiliania huxleyi CCMP1516]|uniref:Nucleotide-diphospho-sugar transferase domain-containing protein n=2 Tax=Emiliania huxleyi TaxID=2903 RepID=A0A0D3IT21_EMIH1|nr:hypothetical protein EMIHUDRAFT_211848 [Emiliania huxleyi CCMP1516]EOD14406.1 hypothetical protein EMIHUDRAFT_211848 [Emiliania huxleyi CCMP1516]|eukprot:XP_005766835.1 hypothetical protein EMIHUDRAFT_211848 [Emiliania huxleyi CCMP1516]
MLIRVLALTTAEQASMTRCWWQWIESMMAKDVGAVYEVLLRRHVHPLAKAGPSAGNFRGKVWYASLPEKVRLVSEQCGATANDTVLVFSDLDVVALRPYSALAQAVLPPEIDLAISGTLDGASWRGVNSGFYLLRLTRPVCQFLARWADRMSDEYRQGRKPEDMPLMRQLLRAAAADLRWTRISIGQVGENPVRVTNHSFAYHAIGTHTSAKKLARVGAVADKLGRRELRCGG